MVYEAVQQATNAVCSFIRNLLISFFAFFSSLDIFGGFCVFLVLFQVLQKYWNRWKSRLEEKEEEQQQALTSVAHARYRYAEKCSYKLVEMWNLWALILFLSMLIPLRA